MDSPAYTLAKHLEDQGIGTFASDSGWAISVGTQPASPDDAITLYDTPGRSPLLYGDTEDGSAGYQRPSLQVRGRSRDYNALYAKMGDIRKALHAVVHSYLGETTTRTLFVGVWQTSDTNSLGQDDNNRFQLVANYQMTIYGEQVVIRVVGGDLEAGDASIDAVAEHVRTLTGDMAASEAIIAGAASALLHLDGSLDSGTAVLSAVARGIAEAAGAMAASPAALSGDANALNDVAGALLTGEAQMAANVDVLAQVAGDLSAGAASLTGQVDNIATASGGLQAESADFAADSEAFLDLVEDGQPGNGVSLTRNSEGTYWYVAPPTQIVSDGVIQVGSLTRSTPATYWEYP